MIKTPPISNFNTFQAFKKQRFFCKKCNSSFNVKIPLVQKNCNISVVTKFVMILRLMEIISEKDIAE